MAKAGAVEAFLLYNAYESIIDRTLPPTFLDWLPRVARFSFEVGRTVQLAAWRPLALQPSADEGKAPQ